MSTTDKNGWRHTSPLAVVFYIGRTIDTIAKNAVQSLAPVVALLFAYQGDLKDKLVFAAVAIVTLTIASSFIRYLFFRYRITGDSVLIREGVFKKTQLDIKFDRIQAINTEQNIVYRFFKLVTIKIDTAGSAAQEGHLPAVKPELADALREKIRRKRGPAQQQAEDDDHEAAQSRTLLSLNNADMVRIGLSDNRALIFLALLGPLLERIDEYIESMIDENAVLAAFVGQPGTAKAASLFLLLTVGFFALLAVASIIGAFLRYHRFKLVADNEVFQSTGGLLTRHVHSINLHKIQSLVTTQNVMLRMFGRFRVSARQASSSRQGRKKNFAVPICQPDQIAQLAQGLLGEEFPGLVPEPRDVAYKPIARQFIRSRTVLIGVIPAIVATVLMSGLVGWYAVSLLAWIPISLAIVWRLYRRYGVLVSTDGLALRKGFLGYHVTTFLHRKVQRIGITQTFLQRRKGLATIKFFLASGSLKVPYVDHEQAKSLRDFVLYRVESSQLAWH